MLLSTNFKEALKARTSYRIWDFEYTAQPGKMLKHAIKIKKMKINFD